VVFDDNFSTASVGDQKSVAQYDTSVIIHIGLCMRVCMFVSRAYGVQACILLKYRSSCMIISAAVETTTNRYCNIRSVICIASGYRCSGAREEGFVHNLVIYLNYKLCSAHNLPWID
jgi:hypothetical protein